MIRNTPSTEADRVADSEAVLQINPAHTPKLQTAAH
jgi:hypothetical protein